MVQSRLKHHTGLVVVLDLAGDPRDWVGPNTDQLFSRGLLPLWVLVGMRFSRSNYRGRRKRRFSEDFEAIIAGTHVSP